MSKRKDQKYDYYHILNNEDGLRPFTVKGYDTWPSGVLEGQVRITFLESFNTLEEVKKAYPQATMSHELMEPQNSFNHLSDGPDDVDRCLGCGMGMYMAEMPWGGEELMCPECKEI